MRLNVPLQFLNSRDMLTFICAHSQQMLTSVTNSAFAFFLLTLQSNPSYGKALGHHPSYCNRLLNLIGAAQLTKGRICLKYPVVLMKMVFLKKTRNFQVLGYIWRLNRKTRINLFTDVIAEF